MADPENNNGLYFIVGGLVVLALLGFVFFMDNDNALNNITPAGGYNNTAPAMSDQALQSPERTPEETRTELRVDEDGITSSTTRSNASE